MNAQFTFRKTMYKNGEIAYTALAVTTYKTKELAIECARKALNWVAGQYENADVAETTDGAVMYAENADERILLYYELA
jgi:hypothetical protein